jgi:hypothetical protein
VDPKVKNTFEHSSPLFQWSRNIKAVQNIRVGLLYAVLPNQVICQQEPCSYCSKPSKMVEGQKTFLLASSSAATAVKAFLNKEVTFSGDQMIATLDVDNQSSKTISGITVKIKQVHNISFATDVDYRQVCQFWGSERKKCDFSERIQDQHCRAFQVKDSCCCLPTVPGGLGIWLSIYLIWKPTQQLSTQVWLTNFRLKCISPHFDQVHRYYPPQGSGCKAACFRIAIHCVHIPSFGFRLLQSRLALTNTTSVQATFSPSVETVFPTPVAEERQLPPIPVSPATVPVGSKPEIFWESDPTPCLSPGICNPVILLKGCQSTWQRRNCSRQITQSNRSCLQWMTSTLQ